MKPFKSLKLALCSAAFLALGSLASLAQAGVSVNYRDGSTPLKGYLAGRNLDGKRPGVLIVHQWMGLTDYEKGRADQIARELGYVAFAADIYGVGNLPKDTKQAGKLAGSFEADRALYDRRVLAGLAELKKRKNVDPDRIAVIGYCFGGAGAMDMARINAPVAGVVTFHGALPTTSPAKGPVKPKILVLHGADDPYVNRDAVAAFEKEMDAAHADYQVVLYSGTVHAFTQPLSGDDPSKGVAYNAESDHRSWKAMKDFLADLFQ
ncbi:MAG TPA: dienelactone hydrolase family protein [bacterium]|jgi:dienelactone hydrolase|nr:dienelactone hydrolase family protein [bacterium]